MMKPVWTAALLLSAALVLTGCSEKQKTDESVSAPAPASQTSAKSTDTAAEDCNAGN